MNSNNCYVASAGAGKTTYIIKSAHTKASNTQKKIAIVTFTTHNQNTEKQKYFDLYARIPKNIVICGWYSFLLDYIIKPFKGDIIEHLYDTHVSLAFIEPPIINNNGHKIPHYKKGDLKRKYLTSENNIYKDYLSEFAYNCLQENKELLKERFEHIFDSIYFDEAQDFCGYDYDIIEFLIKETTINCTITIDPRQHTYSSSNSKKYSKFKGRLDNYCKVKINGKRKEYINLDYKTLCYSHRCEAEICRFATHIFGGDLSTLPCNCKECEQKKAYFIKERGIYLVLAKNAEEFARYFAVRVLTFNKCVNAINNYPRYNFGECKGDEFECVLIYPTKDMIKWLKKSIDLESTTKSKFYVAVTRAIFTVGIIVPDNFSSNRFNLPIWVPPKYED